MASKSKRGFAPLRGKTISKIDTSAINSVRVFCTDGTVYDVSGENWYQGIPAISCAKVKKADLI